MSFDLTSHYVKHVNCTYSNTTISSMTAASTEMSYLQGSELQALLSLPIGCLGWKIFKPNGQPKCFWPLGTLLGPSGPFWTVSNKNWYFAPKHLCQPLLCPFGAKKSFLSEMVQKGPDGPKMGPKWSKTLRLTILVPFGPFWTTLECWQACHVWPFLVQNGPF